MKTVSLLSKDDRGLVVRCSPQSKTAPIGSIVQRIEMFDGSKLVGHSLWYTSGTMDGHIQILELEIKKPFQRQGFGARLLRIVRDEAEKFLSRSNIKLRRITIEVPHKTQIIGRSFLTKQGFHHVETLAHVLIKQDLLIYQLGLN